MLLCHVYCVWQVVKIPTIILNNFADFVDEVTKCFCNHDLFMFQLEYIFKIIIKVYIDACYIFILFSQPLPPLDTVTQIPWDRTARLSSLA